jgi:hypothetical protein
MCAVITDPSAVAFMRQAIDAVGVPIVLQRVFGYAPNATTFSVNLTARVAKVTADSGAVSREGGSASAPGAVTQNDRTVRIMADDLAASRFPLPVVKGDKVILPPGGDAFDVSEVDPFTFAMAAAIELTVTGVA